MIYFRYLFSVATKLILLIFTLMPGTLSASLSITQESSIKSNVPSMGQAVGTDFVSNNKGHNKRICLITGASSGIGEALSREMIKKDWLVIGVARSLDKLTTLANEFPDSFLPIVCDVSDEKAVKNISEALKAKFCYPELFFLNAGLAGEEAAENPRKIETAHHHKIMATNYFGVLKWIEEWAEYLNLKEKPTTFALTSSVNVFFAPPGGAAYSASKAAITKTFESLQRSYFDACLRFLIIYPGPIATKGLKGDVPFTWSAEKLAKYMVEHTLEGQHAMEPSLFYSVVARLLNWLPDQVVDKLLKKIS
ncbi:MAG: SDR family NAD(P)-dependent oxidoreductase [Proteobacteria bacterium]|nr:SDR family NAD(P)-dependent oxidoreductase [Pseudomonadota bacterium]